MRIKCFGPVSKILLVLEHGYIFCNLFEVRFLFNILERVFDKVAGRRRQFFPSPQLGKYILIGAGVGTVDIQKRQKLRMVVLDVDASVTVRERWEKE